MRNEMNPITVTAPQGLVPFLREELTALGFPVVWTGEMALGTRGDFNAAMRINLWLRTAHHVHYQLGEYRCGDLDSLYRSINSIPWETMIPADGYLSVAATVDHPLIRDHRIVNLKSKDAIVDRILKRKGRRPDSGSLRQGASISVYWKNERCVVSIDTSGEPLSKRGYRKIPLRAPMQETLAAAVVQATGFSGNGYFVNPMCGSGTLAIEAALIAENRAPGLTRNDYAFMHTLLFDRSAWRTILDEAKSAIRPAQERIVVATDSDQESVEAARRNAANAGVFESINFSVSDFRDTAIPRGEGVVVFNPEYGFRLGDPEELATTYREIGTFMKRHCQGYRGFVFTGNTGLAGKIGLKSGRRRKFFSGKIECRLYEYDLFPNRPRQTPEGA